MGEVRPAPLLQRTRMATVHLMILSWASPGQRTPAVERACLRMLST
jgi:hypothetical protein